VAGLLPTEDAPGRHPQSQNRGWDSGGGALSQFWREKSAPKSLTQSHAHCFCGHGPHAGHRVAHYPAGPYCAQCHVSLPVPAAYSYAPPQAAPGAKALPEGVRLTHAEVQALLADVVDRLPTVPDAGRPVAPPAAQEPDAAFLPASGAVAARREVLRAQAAELEAR
jgi:hypothetical protein